MSRRYYGSIESIDDPIIARFTCYGTIIYVPADPLIDFGPSYYPQREHIKKTFCPRVLLISTWTDGKWGFIGGAGNAGETPLACMNREFEEEVGMSAEFCDEDYSFSQRVGTANRATHVYTKITHDLSFFTSCLTSFHGASGRTAYVDEVISITGLPLWIEGPEVLQPGLEVWYAQYNRPYMHIPCRTWRLNYSHFLHVFFDRGLPRFLVGNGAMGMFSSGPWKDQMDNVREQFLLTLLASGVVSKELMQRAVRPYSRAFYVYTYEYL